MPQAMIYKLLHLVWIPLSRIHVAQTPMGEFRLEVSTEGRWFWRLANSPCGGDPDGYKTMAAACKAADEFYIGRMQLGLERVDGKPMPKKRKPRSETKTGASAGDQLKKTEAKRVNVKPQDLTGMPQTPKAKEPSADAKPKSVHPRAGLQGNDAHESSSG